MGSAESGRRRPKACLILAVVGITVAPTMEIGVSANKALPVAAAVRLAADDASPLNVPVNLFLDLVNAPYNEMRAINVLADAYFWTGNWFSPSATNLWGEDPGDPSHFMGILDVLLPFAPQLSGLDQPEIDPALDAAGTAGLGQQLSLLADAELPVSVSCDAIGCPPMVPPVPVTGLTALDKAIDFLQVFGPGSRQLPMFAHWLQVPLQQLQAGFTFPDSPRTPGNPVSAGIADPSAGVGPGGSVPGAAVTAIPDGQPQPGFGFPGTHPLLGADGAPVLTGAGNSINLLPWAGVNFKFDPSGAFQQWVGSLEATPDLNDVHQVGADEVFQAFKALYAGLVVDFDPAVPGSSVCPGLCDGESSFAPPSGQTAIDIVKTIQGFGTPNPLIAEWLTLSGQTNPVAAVGDANGATNEQVVASVEGLQSGLFTFNRQTEDQIINTLIGLDGGKDDLAKLVVNSGLLTDPGELTPWQQTPDGNLIPPGFNPQLPLDQQSIGEFGGNNPPQVLSDLLALLGFPDPAAAIGDAMALSA